MRDLSGSILALAVLGALGLMFATYAGAWYVAHQMAWWTFSLTWLGAFLGYHLVKATFKTLRNK